MKKSVFRYNCEKFSAKDIISFLEEKGIKVDYEKKDNSSKFIVKDLNLFIQLPDDTYLKYTNSNTDKWFSFGVGASIIIWKPINKLYREKYYAQESGDQERKKNAEKAYEEWHSKSKKVYNMLKRRFSLKENETPMGIKDLDWLRSLNN